MYRYTIERKQQLVGVRLVLMEAAQFLILARTHCQYNSNLLSYSYHQHLSDPLRIAVRAGQGRANSLLSGVKSTLWDELTYSHAGAELEQVEGEHLEHRRKTI